MSEITELECNPKYTGRKQFQPTNWEYPDAHHCLWAYWIEAPREIPESGTFLIKAELAERADKCRPDMSYDFTFHIAPAGDEYMDVSAPGHDLLGSIENVTVPSHDTQIIGVEASASDIPLEIRKRGKARIWMEPISLGYDDQSKHAWIETCVANSGLDGGTQGSTWGSWQNEGLLGAGWNLLSQSKTDGSDTRWSVAKQDSTGSMTYLDSSGSVKATRKTFSTESEARSAFQAWLDDHPNQKYGSWQVKGSLTARWNLMYQANKFGSGRRWAVIGSSGGQTVYLKSDGTTTIRTQIFDTEMAARSAFQSWLDSQGQGNDDQNEEDQKPTWGSYQTQENLGGGWVLILQEMSDGSDSRWAVIGSDAEGRTVYLKSDGSETLASQFYDSEKAARSAFQAWLETHDPAAAEESAGSGGSESGSNEDGGSSSSSQPQVKVTVEGDDGTQTRTTMSPLAMPNQTSASEPMKIPPKYLLGAVGTVGALIFIGGGR